MQSRSALLILVLAVVSGCCAHGINVKKFDSLKLDQQVASYEEAWNSGCIRSERGWLLRSIASHGYPAADLMVVRLKQENSRFPAEDAISILEYVHLEGADLLDHEALSVLDNIAKTGSSEEVRLQARNAADLIRKQRPSRKE
jgi:hypothetical protein